jgi:DNA-binding MarR family transcriptional regulator
MAIASSVAKDLADDDVVYPASESIGLLMRVGLRGLRAAFKATLARHKIQWSSWYYLRVLWESDGISQRELTQRVGAMQPNTVSTLRTMEKAGLVRIERPESDRRSTKVWLTPKARRLMQRVLPEIRAARQGVAFENFSEREEAEFKRLLNKLCENVTRSGSARAKKAR